MNTWAKACTFTNQFRENALIVVQHDLSDIEEELAREQSTLLDSNVLVEVEDWIADLGTSISRCNKYFHTMPLYWHLRNLLRNFLFDR